ncbi:hypothetical protein [Sunxiuqinia indica]|uniref:hypothetical protein n=1 Tax=Sunxiuqinia indica TaxID=2692584 RepID=UPI00135BAFF9|nr:hypothetical protein [Sunxiuqinia indica]
MTIAFRPLAEVKMMLEEIGNDVSYAYDDLVFVEHTAFMFQFDDENPENLKLYLNTEVDQKESDDIKKNLVGAAQKRKLKIVDSGYFKLKEKEDTEEFDILFFPK